MVLDLLRLVVICMVVPLEQPDMSDMVESPQKRSNGLITIYQCSIEYNSRINAVNTRL